MGTDRIQRTDELLLVFWRMGLENKWIKFLYTYMTDKPGKLRWLLSVNKNGMGNLWCHRQYIDNIGSWLEWHLLPVICADCISSDLFHY
jgi:hypothetical protein